MDAKEAEIKWMIMGAASSIEWAYHTIITYNVLFPAGVSSVILVSIVSFIVFDMQGGDLIIGISFMVGPLFLAYTVSLLIGFGCSLWDG